MIPEVVSGHQDSGLDLVQMPLKTICTAAITASENSQCTGCQEHLAFIVNLASFNSHTALPSLMKWEMGREGAPCLVFSHM